MLLPLNSPTSSPAAGSDIARLDKLSPSLPPLVSLPFLSLLLISLLPRYPPTLVRISLQRASSQLSSLSPSPYSAHPRLISPSLRLPSRFTRRAPHTSPPTHHVLSLSLALSPRVVGLICETAVPGIHPRLGLSFIAASPLLFLRHY